MSYIVFFQGIAAWLRGAIPYFECYPCPEDEIAQFERGNALDIPPAIRIYLSVMGGAGGDLSVLQNGFPTLQIIRDSTGAASFLGANGQILDLDSGQGYSCLYASLDGQDDPEIYVINEEGVDHVIEDGNPSCVAPTFTAYMRECAIQEVLSHRGEDRVLHSDGGDDAPFSRARRDFMGKVAAQDRQKGVLTSPEDFEAMWFQERKREPGS